MSGFLLMVFILSVHIKKHYLVKFAILTSVKIIVRIIIYLKRNAIIDSNVFFSERKQQRTIQLMLSGIDLSPIEQSLLNKHL